MLNENNFIPYHTEDPTGQRVLVLAPHPDDETFGCGGTLALHTAAGDSVQVIILTDGSRGDFSGQYQPAEYQQIRRQETQQAGKILGIHDLHFWPFKDRQLAAASPEAQSRLRDVLDHFQPQRIYAPSMLEFHPDHRAAARLLIRVLCQLPLDLDVAFYEINQPLCINTLVDITPVLSLKKMAIAAYSSQLAEQDYDDYALALNRFRSQTLPPEVSHAEGFSLWSAATIRKWLSFRGETENTETIQGKSTGYTGMIERQLPFLAYRYKFEA